MGMFDSITKAIDKASTEAGGAPAEKSDKGGFKWGGNLDLDMVLEARAAKKGQKSNWKTSVADLFQVLDLDPSYENRKELAKEMGRADYSGTAEDNIWLHKETIKKLEANGARVPDDMKG